MQSEPTCLRRECTGVLLIVAALAVLTLLAAWANPIGDFWGFVEPPKAQCEAYNPEMLHTLPKATVELYEPAALNRLLREPQNTVSNLAYAAAGIAILFLATGTASRSFALACLFLAFGSGLYHASLLPEWRLIDIMGVYVVLGPLLALAIGAHCATALQRIPTLLIGGVVWLAAFWCAIHRNDFRWHGFKPLDSKTVVVVFVTLVVLLAVGAIVRASGALRRRRLQHLLVLTPCALLAFAGGQGDRFQGFWANPTALVQGHTVWHAAGAFALYLAHQLFTTTAQGVELKPPTRATTSAPGSLAAETVHIVR